MISLTTMLHWAYQDEGVAGLFWMEHVAEHLLFSSHRLEEPLEEPQILNLKVLLVAQEQEQEP